MPMKHQRKSLLIILYFIISIFNLILCLKVSLHSQEFNNDKHDDIEAFHRFKVKDEKDFLEFQEKDNNAFNSFKKKNEHDEDNKTIALYNLIDNQDKSFHRKAAEAYGFILGQEYTLRKIENKYPHLSWEIKKTEISFNLVFGNSKRNLRKYLKNKFGEKGFRDFEKAFLDEAKQILSSQFIDEQKSKVFLNEVENRAKGHLKKTLFETLLCFQYLDTPHKEFIDGYIRMFRTRGHPKSKNTDWQIKVPLSWKAQEGNRPNIIQKFTNNCGDGDITFMLMVLEMPSWLIMNNKDKDEYYSEENMRAMINDDATVFLSFEKTKIDGQNGGILIYEQTDNKMGYTIKSHVIQYSFIYKNMVYLLNFFVTGSDQKMDIQKQTHKYMPLIKLIANSIVLNEQY